MMLHVCLCQKVQRASGCEPVPDSRACACARFTCVRRLLGGTDV